MYNVQQQLIVFVEDICAQTMEQFDSLQEDPDGYDYGQYDCWSHIWDTIFCDPNSTMIGKIQQQIQNKLEQFTKQL